MYCTYCTISGRAVVCCQLTGETAARDAQLEAEKRALAAEETARKKAAGADKKGKGGKELSPTSKRPKGKETSLSPVPAGMMIRPYMNAALQQAALSGSVRWSLM